MNSNTVSSILSDLYKRIDERALVEKIRINCEYGSDRNLVLLVTEYLEKRGYIKTTFGYIKDFVIIYFDGDKMVIKHDIHGSKSYVINDSYLTELPSIVKYFERL